ncbi:hypothetical protein CDAR_409531 [Caerostris darwini]|uniref:C2H2-type domain-containing protein n=1 Tax=Caerostris darwini TaxID=1538125 RepID=A0AAV4S3H1_9ARAC|nr:hypothetical protein CDAR_409531 [Caerostris darwini]
MAEEERDIRNYLASFHKEIEKHEDTDSLIEEDSDDVLSAGELCGYLTENEFNEGIYIKQEPDDDPDYYPTTTTSPVKKRIRNTPNKKIKTAEIIRLGENSPLKVNKLEESSDEINKDDLILPGVGEELQIDEQHTLEMVAQFAEQAVSSVAKNSELSGLENGSSYHAVTIVPSDTNPGELSYVLFVSDDSSINKTFFNMSEFEDTFLNQPANHSRNRKLRAIRLSTNHLTKAEEHVCAYCSYTSPKRYLLSRHMKSHSNDRPHKCGVCERGFKTLASLQNHVNTHTGTRPHPCKDCESCFTTSGELVRHVRYKHTHEKPHKCTECDYASVELSKLKRHMRCHTGERPYQCPHCTYASPDTYKLKRHLRIHTGEKPYECEICQTRFTQSNSLKAHRLIHTGNKPVFQCEYCPTTCGRKTDLRIHMEKLHSSDNPHRCKRCGKVFLDRYSYKIHVKSHDGEKCFRCDLCDYASSSQRHLETHMLVHTDQKPFQCDECDLCFRQKQLLKRHKNLYHNPDYVKPEPKEKTHVCAICFKAFRHKGNLMRHHAIHDPDATASEKEVAMTWRVARQLGMDEEGEEDEDYSKQDDMDEDDKQVVVFEVIQLPSSDTSKSTFGQQNHYIMQPTEDNVFEISDGSPYSVVISNDVDKKNKSRNKRENQKKGTLHRSRHTGSQAQVLKIVADKHVLSSEDNFFSNEFEKIKKQQIQKDLKECLDFNDCKEEYLMYPNHLDHVS